MSGISLNIEPNRGCHDFVRTDDRILLFDLGSLSRQSRVAALERDRGIHITGRSYGIVLERNHRFQGSSILPEHGALVYFYHVSRLPMAPLESMTMPSPSKPYRIRRFWIGVNVARQIIIMIAIVAMINYLGFNWYQRWDLSRNRKYTLSSLTHNVLNSLTKDVAISVFFSPASRNLSSQLYEDVQNLLREYELAGHHKVHVESIDPYRDLTRARAIEAKYHLGAQENLLIIDYQGHTKILHLADLAEYDQTGVSSNTPQVKAFRGEQAITSALTELIEGTLVKIGLIVGHGEPALGDDTLLGQLRQYVERQILRESH